MTGSGYLQPECLLASRAKNRKLTATQACIKDTVFEPGRVFDQYSGLLVGRTVIYHFKLHAVWACRFPRGSDKLIGTGVNSSFDISTTLTPFPSREWDGIGR
jgi:hypothetical protein